MKKLFYLLLIICMISCNGRQNNKASKPTETIPVDLSINETSKMNEVIEKIELIPLQTDTNCLVSAYDKVEYSKELDMYMLLDKRMVVSLFGGDGTFLGDSKNHIGDGPNEYRTAVDVNYNPHSKAIEILNPFGNIYRYDTSFQFQEKISLEKNDKVYARFYPLSKDEYILTPAMTGYQDAILLFCNYTNKQIAKQVSYQEDCISSITMNYNPFFKVKNELIFSPLNLNYHFYRIDKTQQKITPIIQLDLQKDAINRTSLIDQFGEPSRKNNDRENVEQNLKVLNEINAHLLNSGQPLPIIKFYNERYVYVYFLQKNRRISYIYNKERHQSYLLTDKAPQRLYFCLGLQDNCLFALVQPYEIEEYIDPALLSTEHQQILQSIQYEDNAIVVKYYLK